MSQMFQVSVDARGDLIAADGVVIDRSNGAVFPVGNGALPTSGIGGPAPHLDDAQEIPRVTGTTLLGGSGRNIKTSGGPDDLALVLRPARPGFWKVGNLVIEVTGSSAATLTDGVDVVAELTTGGTAPVGSYVATTYGQTTYNGGSAFTLTAAAESGSPSGPNEVLVTVSEGTAQGGTYTSTEGINYESSADPDWTLVVNSDGTADLAYLGTVMASRLVGNDDDPCGVYEATEDGKILNPEFADDGTLEGSDVNPFGVLTLTFNWSGTPDLDIGVSFLGDTVGFGYGSSSDYLSWGGDNTTAGGPEVVTVDLAAAWDAGEIDAFADVTALADWYPPAGGSGPASLTVAYSLGGSTTYTLHPQSATPAITPALALRVTAAGSVAPTGGDWAATVAAVRKVPMAGVVYIAIADSAGAITGATGPFLAASLPSSGGGTTYYPIATSDGSGGVRQVHTGPLLWAV